MTGLPAWWLSVLVCVQSATAEGTQAAGHPSREANTTSQTPPEKLKVSETSPADREQDHQVAPYVLKPLPADARLVRHPLAPSEDTAGRSAGNYKITTVSDDGIRLWIGEQKVIEDWTWHPPTRLEAEITLEAGMHEIRIEHFEIDGFAQLQFRIEPHLSEHMREPGIR